MLMIVSRQTTVCTDYSCITNVDLRWSSGTIKTRGTTGGGARRGKVPSVDYTFTKTITTYILNDPRVAR